MSSYSDVHARSPCALSERGQAALLEQAVKFGELKEGDSFVASKEELKFAFDSLTENEKGVLQRVASRIRGFAQAQRDSVKDVEHDIPGGKAGQLVTPVDTAGCYAPGGRYPLPSSVLMTAVTAKVAGVKNVWVANPKPDKFALAAAHVAGADGFLKIGGSYAYANVRACVHACIHARTHKQTFCMHACMHTCIRTLHACACTHDCTHVAGADGLAMIG